MREEDLLGLFESVKNWGRWGPEDERGTLNLITSEHVASAASRAREGVVVGCGRIDLDPSVTNLSPPQHHMLAAGDAAPVGCGIARDFIGLAIHGNAATHIDALCHIFFEGLMYNGREAALIKSTGATANSIGAIPAGIATRGVLLDLTQVRDEPYLDPNLPIHASELEEAERLAGVTVGEGDALIVRVGRYERRQHLGPAGETTDGAIQLAGLHVDCLSWMHERGIALLASDGAQDALPSEFPNVELPIHIGALVYMGLYLLDNAKLDLLAEACRGLDRWEFLFTVAPLGIDGATGSPVNPLAIF